MTKKEKIETKNWIYIGEVKNNQPHGKGKRFWGDKITKYEGQFLNGKEQGYGKLKINNGGEVDYYEGNFKKGRFHGKGIYYEGYNNKKSYEAKHVGIWKNGEPKEGTTLEKHHKHKGQWVKYEGQWVSSIKHDWGLPMKQGKGIRVFKDGTKLIGTFYYDEFKKGDGIINFGDSKYVGQIKMIDGSTNYGPHGKGIDKFKSGTIFEGIFKNARFYKATNMVLPSKDLTWIYKGELTKSNHIEPNGKGILKTYINRKPTLYIYEMGNFRGFELQGNGLRIYYLDKKLTRPKSIYKGQFKNNTANGKGIYWQFPCDWFHEGNFKNGNFVDDINKTKKLNKKVLDLIEFSYNLK